uniref:TSEN34 tRNA splicing endonuclease subunit n=1 Tax=Sinocyclocheilus grahami TaxID=75366 RepID=A0A672QTQ4_SINGR
MDGDPAGMHLSQQSSSSMEVKEDMDTESEHQPSKDALIDISFCGSTPLLWKVSDMRRCRSVGAIGALVGSLARQPRQNVRLAASYDPFKMCLILYEHSEAVRQYEAGLESSYKEQCALALEDKKTVLRRIMNEKENTSGSHLHRVQPHTPSTFSALRNQVCILRLLSLVGSFQSLLPLMEVFRAREGVVCCPNEETEPSLW